MSLQRASLDQVSADLVYRKLISLHAGRSAQESLRLNARLILLLIDGVGDPEMVCHIIDKAAFEPVRGHEA
jgi:hypothetical protein